MKQLNSSTLQFGTMFICLLTGTILLLFNRSNLEQNQVNLELLKDSVIQNVQYEHRSDIFSKVIKFHQLNNTMHKMSAKDSLTQKDEEVIKHIDQQLNQLLHGKN